MWAKLRAGVSASETFVHSKGESVTRWEGHAGASEMMPHVLGTIDRYADPHLRVGTPHKPVRRDVPPKTHQVATKDTV